MTVSERRKRIDRRTSVDKKAVVEAVLTLIGTVAVLVGILFSAMYFGANGLDTIVVSSLVFILAGISVGSYEFFKRKNLKK